MNLLFTMNRKTILTLTLGIIASAFLLSCGGKEKTTKAETPKEETTPTTQAKDMSGFGDMIDAMPSPSSIPALLQRSDISFNEELINAESKAPDYTLTNDKAALNLGVYSTDLGYLCSYSQADQALSYFKASQTLVDKIGIAGAIEQTMLNRFESNLSDKDSLVKLVDETSDLAKVFLNENENYNTSALIVVGSFVEGLYLATASVANYPDEEFKDQLMVAMMQEVAEQDQALKGLINLVNALEDGSSAKEMSGSLNDLLSEFEKLGLREKLKNNDGSFVLKAEMMEGITNKVAEIRGNIVG